MSSKKMKKEDIVISRVVSMLIAMLILSALTVLYYMPFRLRYLEINNYHRQIEYAVMGITFAVFAVCSVFAVKTRKNDHSGKVITPVFWTIISVCAFTTAVVMPLSSNRGLFLRYSFVLYGCVFAAYVCYHYVSKTYAFHTLAASLYSFLFIFADKFYSTNAGYEDKPKLSHGSYLCICGAIIVLVLLISVITSRRIGGFRLLYPAVFSCVSAAAVLVRLFVVDYVSLAAIAVLAVLWLVFAVVEKRTKKHG